MRKLFEEEGGQATVEYILMLSMALGTIGMLGVGFRKVVFSLWGYFTRDIATACPGCPPAADAPYGP